MHKITRSRTYASHGFIGKRLAKAHALQLEAQRIAAELTEHRQWLTERMQRLNLDRIEHEDLVITRKLRHKWSYSTELEDEMRRVTQLQKREQAEGVATDSPTVYVALTTRFSK